MHTLEKTEARDTDGRLIEEEGKHYAGIGCFRYETEAPRCFRIIRFRFKGSPRTIKSNLTEAEAQAHCSKESTHGNGWFDGYDYMKGCKPRK